MLCGRAARLALTRQRTPLGLGVYLSVQALLLCFAFYALSFLEALARWARGGDAVPLLSRPLHAASPLVHALSAFVAAAFYTCIWPDAAFQAAHVAPKARLRARAACVARHWRRLIRPVAQAQAGLPVAGWMHEVHAGPLLLAALDLAGARDAELPLPRAAPLAGAAAAVAGAYWAALSWAARTAGACGRRPALVRAARRSEGRGRVCSATDDGTAWPRGFWKKSGAASSRRPLPTLYGPR